MIYKPTILNISAGLFIVGLGIYTLINYKQLSANEGWGIVGIVGLLAVGAVLLLIDLVVQQIIKNEFKVNIIGAVVTAVSFIILFFC